MGVGRLLKYGFIALAAFALVYLLAVQTELGQRADRAALEGSLLTPDGADDTADRLLRIVSVGSLFLATCFLSGLALMRRRPGLLLIPAAVIGGSLIATEILKHLLLPRPALAPDAFFAENTLPSGHTTVAVSIAMTAVLIAPPRLRVPLAFLGAALSATAGVFVVTAEWHRPSDPIASLVLTLAVACFAMAGLRRWQPTFRRPREPGDGDVTAVHRYGKGPVRLELAALLTGVTVFVGALVAASVRYGAEVDWNRFHAAFLVSAVLVIVVSGLVFAALLRALEPRD